LKHNFTLPCTEYVCRTVGPQHKLKIVLLEHLLPNTYGFIENLSRIGRIELILGKEYTNDKNVVEELKNQNFRVQSPSYAELDRQVHYRWIIEILKNCKATGTHLVVVDVGGYFSAISTRIPNYLSQSLAGIVEDTTYGLNKYAVLARAQKLTFPIFEVARSRLKEIECISVGESVVKSLENLLGGLGTALAGKRALVIGYGLVGKPVARFLNLHGARTRVYDISSLQRLRAGADGFDIFESKKDALSDSDIVICATGAKCIVKRDFEHLVDGTILCSAGSRDTEVDLLALKQLSSEVIDVSPHVREFRVDGKSLFVLGEGRALNFLTGSLPDRVADLIFSEIIVAIYELNRKRYPPGLYHVADQWIETIARVSLSSMKDSEAMSRTRQEPPGIVEQGRQSHARG
jgi:adenosylhomocysteinase